ncbi:kinase domain-containing protein [Lyophyllum atratum]|nr:kinase domain-containing protein [Lyophyllum atratum]
MSRSPSPTEYYEPVYVWIDRAENLEQYEPGGYHPVHLGDEFQGRYCIVHKLGFGSYSTVWLARDLQANRFVALKFIIADASEENGETRILHHISTSNPSHPGRRYVTKLLDSFEVRGPNGLHRCLVTEVAGPSIGQAKHVNDNNHLPVPIARKVASQCVQGLAFLHSCGVVHGDFHYHNLLFTIPGFHSWSIEDVYRHFGHPIRRPVKTVDGQALTPAAPHYVVITPDSRPLDDLVLNENCHIKITDFGEAFHISDRKKPTSLGTPISLAAPEIIFGDVIGPPVDVWSLACTIYEVLGDHVLLDAFFGERDEILVEMVSAFGKLPERWWNQWSERSEFFEENGAFKSAARSRRPKDLKERLLSIRRNDKEGQRELSGDLDALRVMLEKMLKYEPKDRVRVEDVVLPF